MKLALTTNPFKKKENQATVYQALCVFYKKISNCNKMTNKGTCFFIAASTYRFTHI